MERQQANVLANLQVEPGRTIGVSPLIRGFVRLGAPVCEHITRLLKQLAVSVSDEDQSWPALRNYPYGPRP
jgi:hypothetical protein